MSFLSRYLFFLKVFVSLMKFGLSELKIATVNKHTFASLASIGYARLEMSRGKPSFIHDPNSVKYSLYVYN